MQWIWVRSRPCHRIPAFVLQSPPSGPPTGAKSPERRGSAPPSHPHPACFPGAAKKNTGRGGDPGRRERVLRRRVFCLSLRLFNFMPIGRSQSQNSNIRQRFARDSGVSTPPPPKRQFPPELPFAWAPLSGVLHPWCPLGLPQAWRPTRTAAPAQPHSSAGRLHARLGRELFRPLG